MSERDLGDERAFPPDLTAEARAVHKVAQGALAAIEFRQRNGREVARDGFLYGGSIMVDEEEVHTLAPLRHMPLGEVELSLVAAPGYACTKSRHWRNVYPQSPLRLVLDSQYDKPLVYIFPEKSDGAGMVLVDVLGSAAKLAANNQQHVQLLGKWIELIEAKNVSDPDILAVERSIKRRRIEVGVAAAVFLASVLINKGGGDGQPPAPSPHVVETPANPELPKQELPTPEPTIPPLGPPEILERRTVTFLGNEFNFNPNRAVGVDCVRSYTPDPSVHQTDFNRGWFPADMGKADPILQDEQRAIVYVGEEVQKPSADATPLSEGLAIEYDKSTGRYRIYTFEVRKSEDQGILENFPGAAKRIEIVGKPLQGYTDMTRERLNQGLTVSDGERVLTVRLHPQTPTGQRGPLELILSCKR